MNATLLAETLFGGHIFSNLLLVGVAYQRGLLPLSAEAIQQAIRLNGVAVERNLQVFALGRQYVVDSALVESYLPSPAAASVPQSLQALVEDRERELSAYQDRAYATKYRRIVDRVHDAETRARQGSESLTRTVAWNLHKLMAYKDEYEVARLLVDKAFDDQVAKTFSRPRRMVYHLHPPLLRRLGVRRKMAFGPWIRPVLHVLAKGKRLRGSPLDPFGWLAARREERELVGWYLGVVDALLEQLDAETVEIAAQIADAPRAIRGYEDVKRRNAAVTKGWVADQLATPLARQAA